jgi:hypothetical protein
MHIATRRQAGETGGRNLFSIADVEVERAGDAQQVVETGIAQPTNTVLGMRAADHGQMAERSTDSRIVSDLNRQLVIDASDPALQGAWGTIQFGEAHAMAA